MSLKFQSSFAAGEIDPALHERTNLQKFNSALATARNVIVGKTGRLISRPGRRIFQKCKYDRKTIFHPLSQVGLLVEMGHLYFKIWNLTTGELLQMGVHIWEEDELVDLHFQDVAQQSVLVTREGDAAYLLQLTNYRGTVSSPESRSFGASFFNIPGAPTYVSIAQGGGAAASGYDVEYAATVVVNGQESFHMTHASMVSKLPVDVDEWNDIVVQFTGDQLETLYQNYMYAFDESTDIREAVYEFRFYRRPTGAGAFGFIGSTTAFTIIDGGDFPDEDVRGTFTDVGQAADYTQTPPTANDTIRVGYGTSGTPVSSGIGPTCMYQQRLLMAIDNKIEASRTGFPFNFTRDYPLSSSSSLSFKCGVQKSAKVLRMLENDGLVAFTSKGVYLHTGALSPTNLVMDRKGKWVIDYRVPPLAIPGGVLFVDRSTNTIRQLLFSQERGTYIAEEMSIFNNHLFTGNRVTSWAFEEGDTPLLWITFVDGTFASFTYEQDHQMRAWTRHDSGTGIEYVGYMSAEPTNGSYDVLSAGVPIFITKKGDERFIEIGIPRYVSSDISEADSESDKNHSIAALDGTWTWTHLINDDLTDDDLTLTPVVADDWEGELTLACTNDAIFTAAGIGAVGTLFRYFDSDGASYDLEVTARASDNSVTVQPNIEFPSTAATNPRLYECKDTFASAYSYLRLDDICEIMATDVITVAPVTPGDWSGQLTLTSADGIWEVAGYGNTEFTHWFEATVGGTTYMEVVSRTSDTEIIVQPVGTYPSGSPTLQNVGDLFWVERYATTMLDHLDDENVAVIGDGYVVASPNNDVDFTEDDLLTVTAGALTIPDKYAFVHIGRPYVMDVETLDVDTVEQRPILIEDKTLNKLYLKVFNSRGLYVASRFPADDTLSGMDSSGISEVGMSDTDTIPSDYGEDNNMDSVIANRYPRARTKRMEITLPGDWRTNSRVCIRQVDPLHFEILSVLLDIEDLRRER